jgi:hypothetical protein
MPAVATTDVIAALFSFEIAMNKRRAAAFEDAGWANGRPARDGR